MTIFSIDTGKTQFCKSLYLDNQILNKWVQERFQSSKEWRKFMWFIMYLQIVLNVLF